MARRALALLAVAGATESPLSIWRMNDTALSDHLAARTCDCLDPTVTDGEQCICKQDVFHPYDVFFLQSCGNAASVFKEFHFINFYELPTEYMQVLLKVLVWTFLPIFITMGGGSMLSFTRCQPQGSPTEYERLSGCVDFLKCMRFFFDLLVLIFSCLLTFFCVWNLYTVYSDFRSHLEYGFWCNLMLYLDFGSYEHVIILLALLTLTATDLVILSIKLIHDFCVMLFGSCCALGCYWKVLCCCIPCKLCSIVTSCCCKYMVLGCCMMPAMFCMMVLGVGWTLFFVLTILAVVTAYFLAFLVLALVVAMFYFFVGFILNILGCADRPQPIEFCNAFSGFFADIRRGFDKTDVTSEEMAQDGFNKFHSVVDRMQKAAWVVGPLIVVLGSLVLKGTMMNLVIYYTLANEDLKELNDMLGKAGLYHFMDWHWAWFWFGLVKHMYASVWSFLLNSFIALFWGIVAFFKFSWLIGIFTNFWETVIAPFTGVWAMPGAGLADIERFVLGCLYGRALIGICWAKGRWCHHQVESMTAKACGSVMMQHLHSDSDETETGSE